MNRQAIYRELIEVINTLEDDQMAALLQVARLMKPGQPTGFSPITRTAGDDDLESGRSAARRRSREPSNVPPFTLTF